MFQMCQLIFEQPHNIIPVIHFKEKVIHQNQVKSKPYWYHIYYIYKQVIYMQ